MNTFNRNLDHLPLGVRSRLETLLSRTGGRLAVLPIDQGLEHGPIDFLDSPEAADPEHQFRLAAEPAFPASPRTWAWPRSTCPIMPARFR
ncbi:hypothetical protein [Meiothermus taiwanensis]|uniref:hypothetical protein n=1 Tax=Meiothermus taiwanensis TaxID=172827 RepID=UPI001CBEEC88|nr:hypothetical protein [Meiothermus taiwanensis]